MKIHFITHFCPHYRVGTFEALAQQAEAAYTFYSDGSEDYWDPRHGVQRGAFEHVYLRGFNLGRKLRVVPGLLSRLWRTPADVIIKCINGRFALPATFLVARWRRTPFVLWTGIWRHPTWPFHRLTFPLTRYLYTHADAIAVYGPHVRDYLISVGVPPERIFIAWHAVNNRVYAEPMPQAAAAQLRVALAAGQRPVVLYVGRLEPSKGLPYLIEAMAQLTDLNPVLVLVGEGALRAALTKQAQAAGIDARFVGYVPTGQLYRYYAIANAFALPSITTAAGRETWGLVVNEAMNQAVPVVASDAVGAAAGGLVRDGETGLIVPERNAAALAQALRKLIEAPLLGRRMGEAGRCEVARWTNERMVSGFLRAAEFALQRRQRSL